MDMSISIYDNRKYSSVLASQGSDPLLTSPPWLFLGRDLNDYPAADITHILFVGTSLTSEVLIQM